MNNETQTLPTLLGHHITVFANDHIGDKMAQQGLYEKENLSVLLALLRQMHSPVVLDIGANIGNHTLAFSTVASKVHCFEPLPDVFDVLTRNIEQNNLQNVVPHAMALSDENGEAILHRVKNGNVGASGFDQRNFPTDEIRVKKRRGDDVLEKLDLDRLDLIKLDVESHEVFALRGLMKALETFRPFITMEWNDSLTIERMQNSEVMAFLEENYTIYVLGSNYDRGYWQEHSFPFLRRKLTRLSTRRIAALYPFDSTEIYKNLLLVPEGREDCLLAFMTATQ